MSPLWCKNHKRMHNADYLTYPSMQQLAQMRVDRGQMERSIVSYTYIQICRQTLSDACGESMSAQTLRFSLGDDLGAQSMAVAFMHLMRNNFNENTGLNGPALTFAKDEFEAFINWIQRNNISLAAPATTAGLSAATRQWIGNINSGCPRSLWFAYAINQPAYANFKNDLKSWRFNA